MLKNIKNDNKMNITMISDKNQYIYSLVNSIIINSSITSNKEIIINLIFYDINEEIKKHIYEIIKINNICNLNINFVAKNDFNLFDSKIKHITPTTNLRIYLPIILKEFENTLYLDNDVVVMGDITEAFNFFDSQKAYGRMWNKKDHWVKKFNKRFNHQNKPYCNAGVIHLPLKIMNENNFTQNAINFLESNSDFLKYSDQDALNHLVEFEPMPSIFNIGRNSWSNDYKEYSNFSKLKIYHFLSTQKQWTAIKENKTKGSLTKKEMKKMDHAKEFWLAHFNEFKY